MESDSYAVTSPTRRRMDVVSGSHAAPRKRWRWSPAVMLPSARPAGVWMWSPAAMRPRASAGGGLRRPHCCQPDPQALEVVSGGHAAPRKHGLRTPYADTPVRGDIPFDLVLAGSNGFSDDF
ncbi:MAG: hypothetical protein MI924_35705 [Chloroflexales bacterium]|nr:hypothetical protein [Chloroflexales bacterium]